MFLSFAGFSAAQFHGYLFERMGHSPLRIGVLLFAGFAAGIAAPLAQVKAIRWLRGPRRPLMLMLSGAGLGMALLPHARSFLPLVAVFFLALFCSSSIHPLNAACALEVTRARGPGLYFVIRALGTAGYLVGCFLSFFRPHPGFLPFLYLGFGAAFLLALPAAAWDLRPANPADAPEEIEIHPRPRRAPTFARALRLLSAPRPKRLLWALGVMNFANAMATLVQGNYLASRFGGGQASISLAWIVSSACEIPLMLYCAWLVRRSGLRAVIGFGLLGTALKLAVLGVAETRWAYFVGLAAHGCFFSGAMAGFNLYVDQRFRVADRPTLQALGSLFYQGLPSACGGLAAGCIWHFLGLRAVYWSAGLLGLAVAAYTFLLLPQLPTRPWKGSPAPRPG
jgi:MFS family permease